LRIHVHQAQPNPAVAKLRSVLAELVRDELGGRAAALRVSS